SVLKRIVVTISERTCAPGRMSRAPCPAPQRDVAREVCPACKGLERSCSRQAQRAGPCGPARLVTRRERSATTSRLRAPHRGAAVHAIVAGGVAYRDVAALAAERRVARELRVQRVRPAFVCAAVAAQAIRR